MEKDKSYNKGCWSRWCAKLMRKRKNLQVENKWLRDEIERIGYNCFDLMEGAGMPEFEIYESIWVWSIDVLKEKSNGKN